MTDKHYVVVGGSRGIGRGVVDRLLNQGGRVTVISRTSETLTGLDLKHIAADVTTDSIDSDSLPETIHGLVYCPGSINLGPVRGIKPQNLIEEFQLNVVGAIKVIQASLAALKRSSGGSIVMFSTVAVAQGMPMHASVATVKGAVEALTRSLAAEFAPHVRVNCIAPSLTDTPLAERLLSSEQKRSAMADRHPMKRFGQVDDIASAVDFLISDQSSWITGQVMGVDGGLSTVRT